MIAIGIHLRSQKRSAGWRSSLVSAVGASSEGDDESERRTYGRESYYSSRQPEGHGKRSRCFKRRRDGSR